MRDMLEHETQLIKIADLHFNKRVEISVIAKKLKQPYSAVKRMLKEVLDRGWIEQKVLLPSMLGWEQELCNRFLEKGIREVKVARVIPREEEKEEGKEKDYSKSLVVALAADAIEKWIKNNIVIGVTCGTTLLATFSLMRRLPYKNLKIVPLNAFLHKFPHFQLRTIDSNALVTLLFTRFIDSQGSNQGYLFPPLSVQELGTKGIQNAYVRSRGVKEILDIAKEAALIICGLGAFNEEVSSPNVTGLLKECKLSIKEMRAMGAVGEINLQPFDKKGEPLKDQLADIDSPKLKKYFSDAFGQDLGFFKDKATKGNARVICIASGKEKKEALLAAIQGQFFDTLIIDEPLARAVLGLSQ